jgi:hypothetical protein
VEEDSSSKVFEKDIEKINFLIDGIDANLNKIPKLEFLDDDGKPYPIERARQERENLYNVLSSQRTMAEEDLETAQRNLKNHIEWRKLMGVELTPGPEDKNTETRTWFVRFYGTEDCKQMEDLLIEKENWPGINLAAGDSNTEPPMPTWVGRDSQVPDGSKANAKYDYRPHQVKPYCCYSVRRILCCGICLHP